MRSSSSHTSPSSLSHSTVSHSSIPPWGAGAVRNCLAASLLLGTSLTFAHEDLWRCDHYVLPDHQKTLGIGDIFIVHRNVHTSWTDPLSLPAFTAQLTHIVGWGDNCVEFELRNLSTGCTHHKTLTLRMDLVRLSRRQRISRFLWPFPRCSPSPGPLPPIHSTPRHKRFSRVKGDRVPRDSDGLPIWHTVRASAETTHS